MNRSGTKNSKSSKTVARSTSENFTFPEIIPVNVAHTLDQLTNRFQSVKDGLPELVKNSKDQYARLRILDREERQIIVVAHTKTQSLAVIDFAGAPKENFEGWTNWSDPDAGKIHIATDIEAGHGNGGKAFMVKGAKSLAFLESCHNGRRTKKGFINNQSTLRYKPGFANELGVPIDDVYEPDPTIRFRELLDSLN